VPTKNKSFGFSFKSTLLYLGLSGLACWDAFCGSIYTGESPEIGQTRKSWYYRPCAEFSVLSGSHAWFRSRGFFMI